MVGAGKTKIKHQICSHSVARRVGTAVETKQNERMFRATMEEVMQEGGARMRGGEGGLTVTGSARASPLVS